MLTKGENHPLSPNTFNILPLETWAAAVQRRFSETKRCFLERIVHYKALSDMEHEFLVVYVSHPSGTKIVLGVDRNARDPAPSLGTRVGVKSLPPSSPLSPSPSEEEPPQLAYDGVQVSHDGTPAPILARHGPHVPLYMITFSCASPPLAASTSTSSTSSNPDANRPPSLLHFSILLLTIRTHFPYYDLFQYQCYFFARVTCLALIDLFCGVEKKLKESKRAATWRGVHVSVYSAGCTALRDMFSLFACPELLVLPLIATPVLMVPAGICVAYGAVKHYDEKVVESMVDRRRIR
jgi:hypothetical protein